MPLQLEILQRLLRKQTLASFGAYPKKGETGGRGERTSSNNRARYGTTPYTAAPPDPIPGTPTLRVEVERPVSWAKLFLSHGLQSCPRYGSPVQVGLPLPTLRDNVAYKPGQVTSHKSLAYVGQVWVAGSVPSPATNPSR